MTHLYAPEAALAHAEAIRAQGRAQLGIDVPAPRVYLMTKQLVALWAERDRARPNGQRRPWRPEEFHAPIGLVICEAYFVVHAINGEQACDLFTWGWYGDDLAFGARNTHAVDARDYPTEPVISEAARAGELSAFMTLLTLQELLAEPVVRYVPPTMARGAMRRPKAADPNAIAILTLRNVVPRDPNPEPVAVPWSHRWEVRGHWRRLRSGIRTWVRPHVKGPDDKPLIRKRKVYRVSR